MHRGDGHATGCLVEVESVRDQARLELLDHVDDSANAAPELVDATLMDVGVVEVDDDIRVARSGCAGHVPTVLRGEPRPETECERLSRTSCILRRPAYHHPHRRRTLRHRKAPTSRQTPGPFRLSGVIRAFGR